MQVVVHEAVRETTPPLPHDGPAEEGEILLTVGVVARDQLLGVPASENMMNRAGKLFPRLTRHIPHSPDKAKPRPRPGSDPARGLTPLGGSGKPEAAYSRQHPRGV